MKQGLTHLNKSIAPRLGLALGMLLIATLACYTPWRKAEAEQEAIAQFALVEEEIYKPTDTVLLAEVHFSLRDLYSAVAGVEQIYATPYSCEEIVTGYREAMTGTGWIAGSGGCDQSIWLMMHTSKAQLIVQSAPSEGSRLAEDWQRLQGQYEGQTLYYLFSNISVEYEEP